MDPVLVTGAAGGSQGSTGRLVTGLLRERGLPVRAFVHTDDQRCAGLRALGAQVQAGDLREIASVLPAVSGVRQVFFTYPVTGGLLDAAAAMASASRWHGVRQVVEVSQLAAAPDAPTPHMRQHWLAEQVFDRAGVGAVHLRAAVFFENLAVLVAAGRGELALPLGPADTVIPLIAAADVARVAAGFLGGTAPDGTAPEGPAPNDAAPKDTDPVCRLTGDIAAIGEIASAFGASGRPVRYVDVDPREWEQQALGLYRDPHTVEHLSRLWEIFRLIGSGHELYQVTDAIERIGGRPPQKLREFTQAWRWPE
jgi:uncharacterized protein YbjT (DUF2867 family)